MKDRITITIEQELLEWLDHQVKEKVYSSRSHGLAALASEAAHSTRY